MATAKIYNQEGKEISELKLAETVFGLRFNADLLHQAVRVALANKRQVLASTKGRSEVSGGGKKPWKQKGTGRARHGSIRSPIWRHGGVSFGPTAEKNFKLKINKKMAKRALLTALSAKSRDNEIIIFDDLKITAPKTKEMAAVMQNFPQAKNALLVLDKGVENARRAARNLPNLGTADLGSLNILDVLSYRYLIFTKSGIEFLNKKYGSAE